MSNELKKNTINVDASKRIAALEATNATLREALSSKNAQIAMLEDRISNMSVELASSRAREEEKSLRLRQSTQVSMMPEDHDNMNIPAELIDDTDSKSASSPAQISSLSSPAQISSLSSSSSSHRQSQRRFSLPIPGRRVSASSGSTTQEDDMNDNSTRSLTGIGGIIGNMNKLDRSDRSQNLRVDFPSGGRQMYRLRISDLTVDYSASEETQACEQEEEHEHEHEEEGHHASASPQRQRRRPNRSTLVNRQHHTNSRLISSTVIFPMEDDDDSIGFE